MRRRSPCDIVLNAIDGAAGLKATLVALQAGATLALANKESLIIGGDLVTSLRQARPDRAGRLRALGAGPVPARRPSRRGAQARASRPAAARSAGGRGQTWPTVTADEALAHPTWDMGPLVTINSSTLVNKGLEVIEAHLLFGLDFDRIEVVVHPQSIVHSMVEFYDGSTHRAGLAAGHAAADRARARLARPGPGRRRRRGLDAGAELGVRAGRPRGVPGLGLAVEAGARGGLAPAVYNAANEVCVEAFLTGRLSYLGIVDTVAAVLAGDDVPSYEGRLGVDGTVDEVLHAVAGRRRWARERDERR